MAKKGLKGLVNRLVEGKEKSEDYARASLPSNRWELFWDIFKGRFGKLIIVNLLVLLFFIPVILLFFYRYLTISAYGMSYPYGQVFGVGYMAPNTLIGMSENIIVNVNTSLYLLLPVAMMIASVGISGGAYVIRNMVWTEGVFVANDFWRGIAKNYKKVVLVSLMFSVVFYVTFSVDAMLSQMSVLGSLSPWLASVLKVLMYFVFGIYSVMSMHMITMTVTYEYTFFQLFKNSFLFTVGLFPHNVFFGFLAMLPFILFSIDATLLKIIAVLIILLIGFSYILLIWTDFSQWAYDGFINQKIGAKKNRGIYEKVVDEKNKQNLKKYKQQVDYAKYSARNSRPVKPITDDELQLRELPTSFNREDIQKLNESRQAIIDDNLRYIEERKKELESQTFDGKTVSQLEDERQKRIEKAKRELAKRRKK